MTTPNTNGEAKVPNGSISIHDALPPAGVMVLCFRRWTPQAGPNIGTVQRAMTIGTRSGGPLKIHEADPAACTYWNSPHGESWSDTTVEAWAPLHTDFFSSAPQMFAALLEVVKICQHPTDSITDWHLQNYEKIIALARGEEARHADTRGESDAEGGE